METKNEACKGNGNRQFKSYYVVWKQGWSEQDEESDEKFKSYYVVWKLNFLLSPSRKLIRFKSYYVVWKRLCYYLIREGLYRV